MVSKIRGKDAVMTAVEVQTLDRVPSIVNKSYQDSVDQEGAVSAVCHLFSVLLLWGIAVEIMLWSM